MDLSNFVHLEHLLNWNAAWVLIWAVINLFFTIMLFFGKGNGIYRAMQLYMICLTALLFRNSIVTFVNVTVHPEPYYMLSVIQAFIAPAGALSAIYLAYCTWKAKQ